MNGNDTSNEIPQSPVADDKNVDDFNSEPPLDDIFLSNYLNSHFTKTG